MVLHPRQINRANHHAALGASALDQDKTTTQQRYATARGLLDRAETVADVLALCRSHESEQGVRSICRHGEYTTVYSYVFDVTPNGVTLHVTQGNPCYGAYQSIPIRFPAEPSAVAAVMHAYPSSLCSAASIAAGAPGGR